MRTRRIAFYVQTAACLLTLSAHGQFYYPDKKSYGLQKNMD